MSVSIPKHMRIPPIWLSVAIWLGVFLTPTAFLLLLLVADNGRLPPLPEGVVVTLLCLIPVVALLVCGSIAWLSKLDLRWRVGWLALTVLAMLLQCGALLVMIMSAITVAIAPAQ